MRKERDWAAQLAGPREHWTATVRGVVPLALPGLVLLVLAVAAAVQLVRALVLSGGDWAAPIEVPVRAVLSGPLVQPAGAVVAVSAALAALAGAGAVLLAVRSVARIRDRRRAEPHSQ